jgi:hypothetical protein
VKDQSSKILEKGRGNRIHNGPGEAYGCLQEWYEGNDTEELQSNRQDWQRL